MHMQVAHIREILAGLIGERLVDVTQHDTDARDQASPDAEVFLHFSNGQILHFWIDEVTGFEVLNAPAEEGSDG